MQKPSNKLILITLFAGLCLQVSGQSLVNDLLLVKEKTLIDVHENDLHTEKYQFLLKNNPSFIVKYNPFTLVFGGMMWLYQTSISEHLPSNCIYSPTCSVQSKNLIEKYGLLPGIIFTADRLTRCNRLALYDYPANEIDQKTQLIHEDVKYYELRKK